MEIRFYKGLTCTKVYRDVWYIVSDGYGNIEINFNSVDDSGTRRKIFVAARDYTTYSVWSF